MRKTAQNDGILFSWDSSINKGDILQTNDGRMFKVIKVERPHLTVRELKDGGYKLVFRIIFWVGVIVGLFYGRRWLQSNDSSWLWDKVFETLHSFGLF